MRQLADSFRRQRDALRNLRRCDTRRQLLQSKCTQNDAHLLNATPQQGVYFGQVLSFQTDRDRLTCQR